MTPLDHLRLGPAFHRRLHADHEARRRHRPRVHGRGGRDRPRGEEGQGGRPRGRPVVHRLRPVLVLPAPAVLALRQHAPEARAAGADVRLSDGRNLRLHPRLRRLRGVARRVRPGAASPTTTASTPPRACPTTRCCSSPTPPRPATWAPTSATSSPATRSPSGAAAASGSMAQRSAYLLGAERVIAIDRLPERLRLAREKCGSETINYMEVDSVVETLKEMTGGRGPDACIDAVGMEAHGTGIQHAYDSVKQALHLQTDRGTALREAIMAVPQGRDPLDPRRLHADGQVPHRRDHQQGSHRPHGPAARAEVHAAPAGARGEGGARPVVPRRPTGSRSRTGRGATRCSSTRRTAASGRSSRRDGRVSQPSVAAWPEADFKHRRGRP